MLSLRSTRAPTQREARFVIDVVTLHHVTQPSLKSITNLVRQHDARNPTIISLLQPHLSPSFEMYIECFKCAHDFKK